MPLDHRIIPPSIICSTTSMSIETLEKSNSNEIIEDVTFTSVVGCLRQLSLLADHAGEIFEEIHQISHEVNERIEVSRLRIANLEKMVCQPLKKNDGRIVFNSNKSSQLHESNSEKSYLINKDSLPKSMLRRYTSAVIGKMPLFSILDSFKVHLMNGENLTTLGQNFSNPDFFILQWCIAQEERLKALEVEKAQQRLNRKLRMNEFPEPSASKSRRNSLITRERYSVDSRNSSKKMSGWTSVARGSRANLLLSADHEEVRRTRSSFLMLQQLTSHRDDQKFQQSLPLSPSQSLLEDEFVSKGVDAEVVDSDDEVAELNPAEFACPPTFEYDKSLSNSGNTVYLSPIPLIALSEVFPSDEISCGSSNVQKTTTTIATTPLKPVASDNSHVSSTPAPPISQIPPTSPPPPPPPKRHPSLQSSSLSTSALTALFPTVEAVIEPDNSAVHKSYLSPEAKGTYISHHSPPVDLEPELHHTSTIDISNTAKVSEEKDLDDSAEATSDLKSFSTDLADLSNFYLASDSLDFALSTNDIRPPQPPPPPQAIITDQMRYSPNRLLNRLSNSNNTSSKNNDSNNNNNSNSYAINNNNAPLSQPPPPPTPPPSHSLIPAPVTANIRPISSSVPPFPVPTAIPPLAVKFEAQSSPVGILDAIRSKSVILRKVDPSERIKSGNSFAKSAAVNAILERRRFLENEDSGSDSDVENKWM